MALYMEFYTNMIRSFQIDFWYQTMHAFIDAIVMVSAANI